MASLLHRTLSCCILLLIIRSAQPARVLLFPCIGGSQYLAMKRIAQELMQRNHEVSIKKTFHLPILHSDTNYKFNANSKIVEIGLKFDLSKCVSEIRKKRLRR